MAAVTATQLRFLWDAAHLMRQTAPETSAHLMSRRLELASTSQAAAVASGAAPIAALPQTDIQRQHICTSCGLILIPGSDGTTLTIRSGRPSPKKTKDKKKLVLERKRKRDDNTSEPSEKQTDAAPQKPPHTPAPHAGITKVYTCGLCHRETRIVLPPPPPLPKQRKHKSVSPSNAADEKTLSLGATTLATEKASAPPASAPTAPTVKASSNAGSKKRAKNRKAGLLALLDKSRSTENSGLNLNLDFDDFRMK